MAFAGHEPLPGVQSKYTCTFTYRKFQNYALNLLLIFGYHRSWFDLPGLTRLQVIKFEDGSVFVTSDSGSIKNFFSLCCD